MRRAALSLVVGLTAIVCLASSAQAAQTGTQEAGTAVATVFVALWRDLLVAAGLGALGGVGLALLQERGLTRPYPLTIESVRYLKLGSVGDVLVGAIAAIVAYAVTPPSNVRELVGLSVIAGIGGSGVLKGYAKGSEATASQQEAASIKALTEQKGGALAEQVKAVSEANPLVPTPATDPSTEPAPEPRRPMRKRQS